MEMKPYRDIFPDRGSEPVVLEIGKKTGGIPKGTYRFTEQYCIDPACDCRRVLLVVLNEKEKPKATISFGFDQTGPFAGPYLDLYSYQAPFASNLLDYFVSSLNSDSEWLRRMYREYREVRELVQKSPYSGNAFPEPGKLVYRAAQPPDLEAELEQSLKRIGGAKTKPPGKMKSPAAAGAPAPPVGGATAVAEGMARIVHLYVQIGVTAPIGRVLALQEELRRFLFTYDTAGEEFAAVLTGLCRRSPEDDEEIDAALTALCDVLDFYEVELEGDRPGAGVQMERFQRALAREIFDRCDDGYVRIAVSNILLRSRVSLHPVLRDACRSTLAGESCSPDLHDRTGEEVLTGIARCLESRRVTSPFDGVHHMWELFAVNDADVRIPVIAAMLTAEPPLLRDIAALMLFDPNASVSFEVARLLSEIDGGEITPETLRRLIMARNWFPEDWRRRIDQAITNARKAHVECARLTSPPPMTVHAAPVDGGGVQGFRIIIPSGARFVAGSVILESGSGIANCYESGLLTRHQAEKPPAAGSRTYLECAPEYLDIRVCHALADGTAHSVTPNHRLLQLAETIGRDRWKGDPFDAGDELLMLRDELAAADPRLLEEKEYLASLEESERWGEPGQFLGGWRVEEESVLDEMPAAVSKGKDVTEWILTEVLEAQRETWQQRLVLNTLLLKFAAKAPVAWHQMFHLAQAVGDATVALKDIPLMVRVAENSMMPYRRGKGGSRKSRGAA